VNDGPSAPATFPPVVQSAGAERPATGDPTLTDTAAACDGHPPSLASSSAAPTPATPEILARLAHELRTPLAAIYSLADVMVQGTFGPMANPRHKEYAESIRDTAHHAIGVVRAMLDPEGLDQQVPEQTFTELDLTDIALQAVRSVEPMARRAGLVLGCQLATQLPRVIADRVAIHQILLNLLSNSVEHAASGGRALVRVGQGAGEVWIEVEDNGPGFVLGDGPDSSSQGQPRPAPGAVLPKGLGLRLAVALARANGARLEVFKSVPNGSRARLTFSPSRVLPV
jgi:two-component system cell cycle sensor histidine kinase PleC